MSDDKKSLRDQAKTISFTDPEYFLRSPQSRGSESSQKTIEELKEIADKAGLNFHILIPTHDTVFIDVKKEDAVEARELLDCYFCKQVGPPVTRIYVDQDRVDAGILATEQWCIDKLLLEHSLTMEEFRALPKDKQFKIIYGGE